MTESQFRGYVRDVIVAYQKTGKVVSGTLAELAYERTKYGIDEGLYANANAAAAGVMDIIDAESPTLRAASDVEGFADNWDNVALLSFRV